MSKKILIVDDDESILDALSLVLEENGYEVSAVIRGGEAYNKARKLKPDLILLDVLMSGKDGRDICKNLKTQEDTKHIPIIMISAHPSAGDSTKEFGADEFLAKPFQVDDLFKLVKKFTKS